MMKSVEEAANGFTIWQIAYVQALANCVLTITILKKMVAGLQSLGGFGK